MKGIPGNQRVVIEHVKPAIDCGQFPIKRIVGEEVIVTADIFGDGHDEVKAALLFRVAGKKKWTEVSMDFLGNDQWKASFIPETYATHEYTVFGWVDHFTTWQKGLKKKFEAKQDLKVELQIGLELLEGVKKNAASGQQKKLDKAIATLRHDEDVTSAVLVAISPEISKLMHELGERAHATYYNQVLSVVVERKKALFSAWYELFPRSTAQKPGKHGTFKDCERILPEIVNMGFDVLYLPPIHPIGRSHRKGKNNAVAAQPGEPGSPWAIGAAEGGHKAIHPELGTLDDFKSFVKKAKKSGVEVALDIAYQCSPEHPYVKEHPQWFTWRPDGTVQYAENPPKKYQDILPINFETPDWQNLWKELKSVIDYWIEQGVNIFRVDNPHTKAFPFWQWMLGEVKRENPDVIFLAEAFTRPRIMERLGKIGFTQSYTYYTWRTNAQEIRQYMEELTQTEMREYYRPNFWPNTPDILPVPLQNSGEAPLITRLIMAATLSSNYGVYGPVYEYGINTPHPGKEEYTDSEKYEIKHWDWNKKTKIKDIITRINQIRKENTAFHSTWNIHFADTSNGQLLAYGKVNKENQNIMLMVVNLDEHNIQEGMVKVPIASLGILPGYPYMVHDLLSDEKFTWHDEWNYVKLDPAMMPVHVFKVEQSYAIP